MSSNGVAVRTLQIVYPKAIDITCFSHTLDRVGEHFNIPILQGFISLWISMFSHSPKARLCWRTQSGRAMASFSATRWWSKWEVMQQVLVQWMMLSLFLTLSGRENLLKISRVDGGWVWPVQSQEWEVKFFVPQATNSIWRRRRVPWRRQCGRYPWASPNLYGSGFSIAVGVVLTTAFTAADRSPKASRNDLV